MAPDKVAKPATRTERQRARTRRQLLDAGRTLIAAKGVAGLRIQDITEQADVALGSFYNYFSSKEELLEAVVTESLSDLAATIITNVPEGADPAEVVALANLRFIRLAYDEPDFARLVINLGHAESLFGRAVHPYAATAVERGIEKGRFEVSDSASRSAPSSVARSRSSAKFSTEDTVRTPTKRSPPTCSRRWACRRPKPVRSSRKSPAGRAAEAC